MNIKSYRSISSHWISLRAVHDTNNWNITFSGAGRLFDDNDVGGAIFVPNRRFLWPISQMAYELITEILWLFFLF